MYDQTDFYTSGFRKLACGQRQKTSDVQGCMRVMGVSSPLDAVEVKEHLSSLEKVTTEDGAETESTLTRTQNNTEIEAKPFSTSTVSQGGYSYTPHCPNVDQPARFPHSAEGSTLPWRLLPCPGFSS